MHSFKPLFLLLALFVSQATFAQETALQSALSEEVATREPSVENESRSVASNGQNSDSDEEEKALQKRKLEIGIILTAGIFLLGLFLVALTLIYGRRTRRQIAAGRGPSRVRDELWYLKHANHQAEENDVDHSQEDTK